MAPTVDVTFVDKLSAKSTMVISLVVETSAFEEVTFCEVLWGWWGSNARHRGKAVVWICKVEKKGRRLCMKSVRPKELAGHAQG